MVPATNSALVTNAREFLASCRTLIDSQLDRLIPKESEEPARVHAAIRWSLFAGGKRFRPALLIAAGQTLGVTSLQVADNVAHVAAGTKRASGAGDHDHAHFLLIAQVCEEVGEFAVDFKGDRVQTLRTIERDRRDAVALFVKKRFWLIHGGGASC